MEPAPRCKPVIDRQPLPQIQHGVRIAHKKAPHAGIIGDLEAPAEALTLGLTIGLHLYLGAMFLQAGQKPLRDTAIHIKTHPPARIEVSCGQHIVERSPQIAGLYSPQGEGDDCLLLPLLREPVIRPLCRQHPPRDRLRDGFILESQGTGSRLCRFFMAS